MHLLLSGLHHYECTIDNQHRTASWILSSIVNTTYDMEVSLQVTCSKATTPTVPHSRLLLQHIVPTQQASFTPNLVLLCLQFQVTYSAYYTYTAGSNYELLCVQCNDFQGTNTAQPHSSCSCK